jgi:poly-gamma-glutamate synthesis protein (capsule biosynthesis protein)
VKRLSDEGDFVIVMPHWGEEYVSTTSPALRAQAKAFVDAGAGAIIGSHPHVVGEQEWMGTVPVFYSLGNFIFDQYFSSSVMKGEIVAFTLQKAPAAPHGAMILEMNAYETSLASHKGPSIMSSRRVLLPLDISVQF